MADRVGLLGGSFDPIHLGHLIAARAVAESANLDRIILLPSANPPHKSHRALAPAEHRREMILRAVAGEALFECSDFDLTREGPTYSIQTIEHFAELLGPESSLCWIIGEDALAELVTWRQAERLLDRCSVLTASRPGFSGVDEARLGSVFSGDQIERLKAGVVETPRIDISSTNIRARVGDGRSIRFLVPDAVWEYIDEHHLYRTG